LITIQSVKTVELRYTWVDANTYNSVIFFFFLNVIFNFFKNIFRVKLFETRSPVNEMAFQFQNIGFVFVIFILR
jgi:hypothetical protein